MIGSDTTAPSYRYSVSMPTWTGNYFVTDRLSGEGSAIGHVRPSIRPFVCSTLFSNQLTLDHDFHFTLSGGGRYCDEHIFLPVCLCVCLFVRACHL